MAGSNKRKKNNKTTRFNPSEYKEIWLFLTIGMSVFLFCSNLGMCGVVGNYVSGLLFGLFGCTEYIVPLYLLIAIVMGLYAWERQNTKRIILWLGISLIAVSFSFQIAGQTDFVGVKQMFVSGMQEKTGGGLLFGGILKYIYKYIGEVGSVIITTLIYVIAFIQITGFSFIKLFKGFFTITIIRDYDNYEEYDDYNEDSYDYEENIYSIEGEAEKKTPDNSINKKSYRNRKNISSPNTNNSKNVADNVSKRINKRRPAFVNYSRGNYVAPPINLLEAKEAETLQDNKQIEESIRIIEETLLNFDIPAKVVNCIQGATVTLYELQVDPKIKLKKVADVSDNLMAGLSARSIRILTPIPGKSTVGIEVPNATKEMVYLRQLLESREFGSGKSSLSVIIGEDIEGRTIIGDIEKMPHMLIAGCSGSGKSVCLNVILMSILYRSSPDDVRLVIIDPKRVEFTPFFDIPHLLIPVVTDMKKASGTLEWLVNEMESRYLEFEKCLVNDIYSYNDYINENKIMDEEGNLKNKLPQILVVIDEFTDLIMTEKTDIAGYVMRLGQKARAAGIHVILATQRPSAKVMPGEIKSNIPTRIALKTASNADSRVILDTIGAEKLLGNGDMLYDDGMSELIRVQGPFVSKNEVKAVTDYIKVNNDPVIYRREVENEISMMTSGGAEANDGERDELFEVVAKYVVTLESISIGGLQRKYRIGFNRAARLIDQLYEARIVGPDNGTKPRDVLISEAELNDIL